MEELVKIKVENDRQLVSARELYKGLGLKIRFSLWVSKNFEGFEEGQDYASVSIDTEVQNNGGIQKRKLQDYLLTIDMAKELCMMSKTKKGKEVRKYFIQVERKWNDPQEVVKRGYAILQNENTRLKLENKRMKPKALFADAVSTSKTAILIGELAKILKANGIDTGQNRLFKWLREKGYLISRKGTDYNMPTQKSMNLGLFKIKETSITHSDGHVTITKTPKVTGKGQQYFINKFLKGRELVEEG